MRIRRFATLSRNARSLACVALVCPLRKFRIAHGNSHEARVSPLDHLSIMVIRLPGACCWREEISRVSACSLAHAPLPFLSGFEFGLENPTLLKLICALDEASKRSYIGEKLQRAVSGKPSPLHFQVESWLLRRIGKELLGFPALRPRWDFPSFSVGRTVSGSSSPI